MNGIIFIMNKNTYYIFFLYFITVIKGQNFTTSCPHGK